MTDLLDARGYEITLTAFPACTGSISYLGAEKGEYPDLTYDEDPYVVSRVENQEFQGTFSAALKDTGITSSGLRLTLTAEPGTEISLTVAKDLQFSFTVGEEGVLDELLDVSGACAEEKAYLAKVHEVLYQLLAEIDRVCRKLGIRYYLVFGGLLGVLRYGEILPWDDDVDVAMTREDFERFKREAPRELGENFLYLDCADLGGDAFLDFMCRVVYMKEEIPVNVFRKVSGKCRPEIENHLPMDIFIMDKASDSLSLHKLQMFALRGVYGLGMGHRAYVDREEYTKRDRFTRLSVGVLSAVGKCIPLRFVYRLHDRIAQMFQNRETKTYYLSNGFLPYIHVRYDREWFETSGKVRLGDLEVCAPADVQAWLKRAYYDYYHFRPVATRIPEHAPEANGVFG